MQNFFVRLICCFIPNQKLRSEIRKKWYKLSRLEKVERKFDAMLNKITQDIGAVSRNVDFGNEKLVEQERKLDVLNKITQDIGTVSRNVDFGNGKLVEAETRFFTLMGPDRFRALKCNKDNFIIFVYQQATHHPTTNRICFNMGDYVQSVAVKNTLSTILKNINFIYFDRDNLLNYYQENSADICIMQGFFPARLDWLPNKHVVPVFIGFHLGGDMEYLQQDNGSEKTFKAFCNVNKEYVLTKSIGCRDKRTFAFCKKLGLNAYFSRCLTLTLPKRVKSETQTKVFVSVFPKIFDSVMDLCSSRGIQDVEVSTAEINLDKYDESVCQHDFMPDCEQYLEKFRNEARLVITDRIHVAAPCIAMGIPTIVIKRTDNDPRYDIFDGIVKCYSEKELINREIDLDIVAPDIEQLKNYMIENVELTIKDEVYNKLTIRERTHLHFIRQQIADFKIVNS